MTKKGIVDSLLPTYVEAYEKVNEIKKYISHEDGGYFWNEKCKQKEPEWEIRTTMIHDLGYYEGVMNSLSKVADMFGYEFVVLKNKKIKARKKEV